MEETVQIRVATRDDARQVAEIILVAKATAMPYLAKPHPDDVVRRGIRDELLGHGVVYVAVRDDAPVGFIALGATDVDHLYVHPDHQGGGVGSALLDVAKERRPNGFQLWVFQRNHRARSFYERRGLVLLYETDGQANEEREPDVRYEWPGG